MLVAHIGSIQKQEFDTQLHEPAQMKNDAKGKDVNHWMFYVNHLGLLGTLMLIHGVNPCDVIISEFGSELKTFHIDLVKILSDIIQEDIKNEKIKGRPLIPAGLTVLYNIAERKFLRHTEESYRAPSKLPFWVDTRELEIAGVGAYKKNKAQKIALNLTLLKCPIIKQQYCSKKVKPLIGKLVPSNSMKTCSDLAYQCIKAQKSNCKLGCTSEISNWDFIAIQQNF